MLNIGLVLSKELNIDFSKKLILSVSGGVDSMVLLDRLIKTNYPLIVVHFDHKKRAESILDVKLVEGTCQKHNIPFHLEKINISSSNFQEKASLLRKQKLEAIAKKYSTSYILTAHHADDLLETILMKISRGSNIYGYAGMQISNELNGFVYIKPMLHESKESILQYAKDHNIAYLEDISNIQDDYTRNRFRHHIVPLLKEENPNILDKIITFSEQLTQAFLTIRKQSKLFINSSNTINIDKFNSLDLSVKMDILSILFENKQITPNEVQLKKVLSLIKSNKPNISYKLSQQIYLLKSYDNFIIDKPPLPIEGEIEVSFGQKINLNYASITFFHNLGNFVQHKNIICYNELAFPLLLRSRRDGDVLELTFGHKKLKDFLIDKKVPKIERDRLYVLTDSNNTILWIPNLYVNKNLGNKHQIYMVEEYNVK